MIRVPRLYHALILTCASVLGGCQLSFAKDPLTPGFPSCPPGVAGYWQPLSQYDKSTNTVRVWIAITSIDYLDPSTVICWIDPHGFIEQKDPEQMKSHTNPKIEVPPDPKEQAGAPHLNRFLSRRWLSN